MTLFRVHGWPIAAAVVVGFLLLPVAQQEYVAWTARQAEQAQRLRPVVRMVGKIVSRDSDSVLIHIAGQRLRTDTECRFAGVTAITVSEAGVNHRANIEPVGAVQRRDETLAIGHWDLGNWRVWPTGATAARVLVMVEHNCFGVLVRSVLADVPLTAP